MEILYNDDNDVVNDNDIDNDIDNSPHDCFMNKHWFLARYFSEEYATQARNNNSQRFYPYHAERRGKVSRRISQNRLPGGQ